MPQVDERLTTTEQQIFSLIKRLADEVLRLGTAQDTQIRLLQEKVENLEKCLLARS